ncbi:MAG: LytTR family transcriptional regulator DNA-binding domain-containing protein [Acidobacteria bacterium]|nr:LytTR family transcriptional regulator DNA-binding domain-containing protein [Acidobacteriota bacterium]
MLLLDVQMPDVDGFGVLRLLEPAALPLVIFATAHDQYAVDAFEVSALDYLLKPVSRRLAEALGKARGQLAAWEQARAQLTNFLQTLPPRVTTSLQRLPVRVQQRILVLGVEQITSLRVDRGLVCVTTAEGEFRTKFTTLAELEPQHDPHIFQRVHRQVLVNLNHVREIHPYDNQTAQLTLSSGHQVSVSRNHLPGLRKLLQW